MTRYAVVALAAGLAACGGHAKVVRSDERAALDCVRQTNAALGARRERSVAMVMTSDDSVAIEPIGLAFGDGHDDARRNLDALLRARVPFFLGVRRWTWTGGEGDAAYGTVGPWIAKPIARRFDVSEAQQRRELKRLAHGARAALDRCVRDARRP